MQRKAAAQALVDHAAAKKDAKHQQTLTDLFVRHAKIAEMRHAKALGLEHGAARAQGLTVEEHRAQKAIAQQQAMQQQAQAQAQGQKQA